MSDKKASGRLRCMGVLCALTLGVFGGAPEASAQTATFSQIIGNPTANLFGGETHGISFAMDNSGYVAFCNSVTLPTGMSYYEIDRGNGGPIATLLPTLDKQALANPLLLDCFNNAIGTNDDGVVSFQATHPTGQQYPEIYLVSSLGAVSPMYAFPYPDTDPTVYTSYNVFSEPTQLSNSLARSTPFPGSPLPGYPNNAPWATFFAFNGGQPTFYPRLELASSASVPPVPTGPSYLLAGTPRVRNLNEVNIPAVSPSGDAAVLYISDLGILTASWFPGPLSRTGIQVNVPIGPVPAFGLQAISPTRISTSLNDYGFMSFTSTPATVGAGSAFVGLASFRDGLVSSVGTFTNLVSDADPSFGGFCESTSLNRTGQVAFISSPAGAGDCHRNLYIVDATGAAPIRVAGAGDVITLNGISWTIDEIDSLSAQSLNDKGQVSFVANGHPTNSATGAPRSALLRADLAPGLLPGNPSLPDPIDVLPGAGNGYRFRGNPCNDPTGSTNTYCMVQGGAWGYRPGFSPWWVDPPPASGFRFTADAGSMNFAGIIIPAPLPGHQSTFAVQVNGQTIPISAGTLLDLTLIDPAGVSSFSIVGIDSTQNIDPTNAAAFVVGLGFVRLAGAPASFTMVPIISGSAPTITPNVSGTIGLNGWYVSDVALNFSIVDPASLVTSQSGCGSTVINTDTPGAVVTCTVNGYNGPWTGSVTIKRDTVAPTVTIATPIDGSSYVLGASVTASYSCTDALSGPTVCAASVANGSSLPTSAAGPHTITVNATDAAGNTSSVTATYTVTSQTDTTPPVISPVVRGTVGNNGWYRSNVVLDWSVSDSQSAIQTTHGCGESTVASDTNGVSFTCSATSSGGTSSQAITIKRDIDPPLAAILMPFDGITFSRNQVVPALYACVDLRSGVAQCSGTVPLGSRIDTHSAGSKAFTVNATDKAGNTRVLTVHYQVR
jgi:hypothetical protein